MIPIHAPGGAGGGPLGCAPAVFILTVVALAMAAFVGAIYWALRDAGQFP